MNKQDLRIHVDHMQKKMDSMKEVQEMANKISWVKILRAARNGKGRLDAYRAAMEEGDLGVHDAKAVVDLIIDGPQKFMRETMFFNHEVSNLDKIS